MRLLKVLNFFFFEKFLKSQGFPFVFLKFCNRTDVKKISKAPFTVFGIVRFFKMNNFCLKIRFSQALHAMSDFCFFFKDRCFLCEFFSNLFSSKLPSIFTRNETFCEHKELFKVFGTVRFTGDLHLKNFSKNVEIFFFYLFFF